MRRFVDQVADPGTWQVKRFGRGRSYRRNRRIDRQEIYPICHRLVKGYFIVLWLKGTVITPCSNSTQRIVLPACQTLRQPFWKFQVPWWQHWENSKPLLKMGGGKNTQHSGDARKLGHRDGTLQKVKWTFSGQPFLLRHLVLRGAPHLRSANGKVQEFHLVLEKAIWLPRIGDKPRGGHTRSGSKWCKSRVFSQRSRAFDRIDTKVKDTLHGDIMESRRRGAAQEQVHTPARSIGGWKRIYTVVRGNDE